MPSTDLERAAFRRGAEKMREMAAHYMRGDPIGDSPYNQSLDGQSNWTRTDPYGRERELHAAAIAALPIPEPGE